jgi:glutathione peroxidase
MLSIAAGLIVAMSAAVRAADAPAADAAKPAALNFTVQSIDGKDVDLSQYAGKVVMIVNVASKCGFTPQYAGLEAMYQKYQDKGFVILGFPANNFHAQEPGTNSEILAFCTGKFDVKFPMFSKISVLGADQAPLYKYLTAQDVKPKRKGDVSWNFEKFVIARDGTIVGRYASKVKPDDHELVSTVEAALAK